MKNIVILLMVFLSLSTFPCAKSTIALKGVVFSDSYVNIKGDGNNTKISYYHITNQKEKTCTMQNAKMLEVVYFLCDKSTIQVIPGPEIFCFSK